MDKVRIDRIKADGIKKNAKFNRENIEYIIKCNIKTNIILSSKSEIQNKSILIWQGHDTNLNSIGNRSNYRTKQYVLDTKKEIIKLNQENIECKSKHIKRNNIMFGSKSEIQNKRIFIWQCHDTYLNLIGNRFNYAAKPYVLDTKKEAGSIIEKKAIVGKLTNIKINKEIYKRSAYSLSYSDFGNLFIEYFKKQENKDVFENFIMSNNDSFIRLKMPSKEDLMILPNIGEILSGSEDNTDLMDSAVNYYQKSLMLINPEIFPNEYAIVRISLGDIYFESSKKIGYNNLEKALYNYAEGIRKINPEASSNYFSAAVRNLESVCKLMVPGYSLPDFSTFIQILRKDELFKLINRFVKIDFPTKCKIDDSIAATIQILIDKDVPDKLKNLVKSLAGDDQRFLNIMVVVTTTGLKANKNWSKMIVPIDGDSNRVSFVLDPEVPGSGLIEFEIFYKSARIGYIYNKIEISQDQ